MAKKSTVSKPAKLAFAKISSLACPVCTSVKLVKLNTKEVKCKACFSVFPLEWLLKPKG